MESYRRALKLAARGSYLHHQLQEQILRGFQQRHEDQKLETEARKILEGQPRHRTALRLLAELLARRPGKLGEAITVYERYLKVVPSDSKVRETVMFLLVGSNRTRDALPHARALYQESPGAARRLLEYTGLLSLTGDREGAGKVLRKAIASFRRDDSALPLIVEALEGLNDREGARLALDALLGLGERNGRLSGLRPAPLAARQPRRRAPLLGQEASAGRPTPWPTSSGWRWCSRRAPTPGPSRGPGSPRRWSGA